MLTIFTNRRWGGFLRQDLGAIFRELALQKDCQIIEGYIMPDHVHMLIPIPPKHRVSEIVGYIKGKSAIWIARYRARREKIFSGEHFWTRGDYVSTIGRNEELVNEYIRNQEVLDKREDIHLTLPMG